MHEGSTGTAEGQPNVTFTIDGIVYSSEERRLTARELLLLADVNPDDHDLARVVGAEIEKRFADDDEVQLTPGAKFVTVFTGSTPVV